MERKKVLFYGAGQHAAMIYRHACRKSASYGEPTAFIDRDIYKQGHTLYGLPIVSWEDAQKQYGEDFYIYVTGNEKAAPEILGFLQEQGVPAERIINYEPVEKRLGCAFAESFCTLSARGNNICYTNCNVAADNLSYQSIDLYPVDYMNASQPKTIHEGMQFLNDLANRISEKNVGLPHVKCTNMRTQYLFKHRKIRTLDCSGSGPCNLKCCYCMLKHIDYEPIKFKPYQVFSDIVEFLKREGLIDSDVVFKVLNGEFSIAEGNDGFIELNKEHPALLYTNALVFSQAAANALDYSSMILCSVDAGTQESFHRVKGVDGFERVCENLREYAKHGPVSLKYILLESLNDSEADLEGFFKLADETAVRVDLTRDFMDSTTRFSDHTLEFAARFIKHFRNNGKLNMSMSAFVRSGEGERLNKFLEEV